MIAAQIISGKRSSDQDENVIFSPICAKADCNSEPTFLCSNKGVLFLPLFEDFFFLVFLLFLKMPPVAKVVKDAFLEISTKKQVAVRTCS